MAVIEYRAAAPRTTAERPIRIFLNDAPVAVSQGSPYDLAELAVGYLLSEGLIADRERFDGGRRPTRRRRPCTWPAASAPRRATCRCTG